MARLSPHDTDFPTLPGAATRARIGPKTLRRAVRRGELSLYHPEGSYPRLHWPEVVAWLRAQRVPSSDHAEARLREVLEREESRRASSGP